jgi:flagellar basal body-associated protein FliL
MIVPGSTAKQNADAKQKIESKPVVENKVQTDSPPKSKKSLILIGSVCLVMIMASTSFLAFPYFKGARTALWTKLAGEKGKAEQVKATLALEPFLVNLADTDEIRFVKTTFQLGLAEEPKEQTKNGVTIAAIRDSIISLLSSKRAEQILTPKGKEDLRKEIRSRVNALAPKTKVLEVYIVDFVVQL